MTKVKLVKVLVFPLVLYGTETWSMRKHERRKIDAFELWCWRRVGLLKVSWMERKSNIWVIENIKPELGGGVFERSDDQQHDTIRQR